MGDNKIAVTKPPMEKVSDFNGIPTSLEKKGNFRYIEKIAFFAKLGENFQIHFSKFFWVLRKNVFTFNFYKRGTLLCYGFLLKKSSKV